jgi:hypothetical protein
MSLVEWLGRFPDRCSAGFSIEQQHPSLCRCAEGTDEWTVFTTALRAAARAGEIHQRDVRPLIQAIPHKHRGLLYRRARMEGLICEAGWEQSTDIAGRNGDKQSRVYAWLGGAA